MLALLKKISYNNCVIMYLMKFVKFQQLN